MTDDSVTEMHDLKPWHQLIPLDGGGATLGKWDTVKQAEMLLREAPWSMGKRVLDAGGNAGGISIALQQAVDQLVVLETNPLYKRQFDYVSQHRDTSRVEFIQGSLFTAHTMGSFDTALILGLLYHFRHPQMLLDYCSQLDCDQFVFSTQTNAGEGKYLWNRSQIDAYSGRGLLGWHPSHDALLEMLEAAKFRIDGEFRIRDLSFTNDTYVFCTRVGRLGVDVDAICKLAASESFWT